MTNENELGPSLTTLALPEGSMAKYDEQDSSGLVGGSFLPRLQVCGSSTDVVKKGQVPVGVWGIVVGDKCDDVGKEVDVLLVGWRPMALKITTDGTGKKRVFNFFQKESPDFKKVIAQSAIDNRNNLWGIQILVWVPLKQMFTGYFLCSDSARREAPNFLGYMEKAGREQGVKYGMAPVTLKLKIAENVKNGVKNSWHVGYADPCTTPLATMPDQASLTDEMTKFMNPTSSEMPEQAPAETRAR